VSIFDSITLFKPLIVVVFYLSYWDLVLFWNKLTVW